MSEIAPDAVSERLEAGDDDLLLVDIRHEDAFEEWHNPGSENIDVYDELNNDPESAADALASLPRDRGIVTVCAAGKMSAVATELSRKWATIRRHSSTGCAAGCASTARERCRLRPLGSSRSHVRARAASRTSSSRTAKL